MVLASPGWLYQYIFLCRKLVLHNQIDGLLSAIALRPADIKSGPEPEPGAEQGPKQSFGLGTVDTISFKIDMVGDSTMRVRRFTYRWTLIATPPPGLSMHCVMVLPGQGTARDVLGSGSDNYNTCGRACVTMKCSRRQTLTATCQRKPGRTICLIRG